MLAAVSESSDNTGIVGIGFSGGDHFGRVCATVSVGADLSDAVTAGDRGHSALASLAVFSGEGRCRSRYGGRCCSRGESRLST